MTANSPPALETRDAPDDGLIAGWVLRGQQDIRAVGSSQRDLFQLIVELAQTLTGAGGAAIAFRGEHATTCAARSGDGAPPLGASIDITSGISRQCLDLGTPLRCQDVATDGRIDPEIARALGFRAVAVVPIRYGDRITGILGVFSPVPGTFTELHIEWLRRLADWVGTAENEPTAKPTCPSGTPVESDVYPEIALLPAWEPAYRVFFRNLADALSLRSPARLAEAPTETRGWDNIFIDTRLPWSRFLQSLLLHATVVSVLSGLSAVWPRELVLLPRTVRQAPVTYYPISQSFPANESSRPATPPPRRHLSPSGQPASTHRAPEPRPESSAHSAADGQKANTLTKAVPVLPSHARARGQTPAVDPTVLPPPPDIGTAQVRQLHLPDSAVVPPAPELSSGSGSRTVNGPKMAAVPPPPDMRNLVSGGAQVARSGSASAGSPDVSIVPPPPSLRDQVALTNGAARAGLPAAVQVVPPTAAFPDGLKLGQAAGGILGGGVSEVVPPSPSLGAGNPLGKERNGALAAGNTGSQVVPPPPTMQNEGQHGGGRGISSAGQGLSQVVPPPPSIEGISRGNFGIGGGTRSSTGALSESALPPTSPDAVSTRAAVSVPKHSSAPRLPDSSADQSRMVFQDIQLRVVGLAWAPQRSSYFSNFEVFIAETLLSRKEPQFIKLVYVFLPYQGRLSEYGPDALRTRKLRVKRDSTCDESLIAMMWPEDERNARGSGPSGKTMASDSPNEKDLLPCYVTTADDYLRAISRNR